MIPYTVNRYRLLFNLFFNLGYIILEKGNGSPAESRHSWRKLLQSVNTAQGRSHVAGAIWSIKKQMAHKKSFPMFHLLTTKALKLWLWMSVPITKLSNPLAFQIQVQVRVTPKSNKHFPGCP